MSLQDQRRIIGASDLDRYKYIGTVVTEGTARGNVVVVVLDERRAGLLLACDLFNSAISERRVSVSLRRCRLPRRYGAGKPPVREK